MKNKSLFFRSTFFLFILATFQVQAFDEHGGWRKVGASGEGNLTQLPNALAKACKRDFLKKLEDVAENNGNIDETLQNYFCGAPQQTATIGNTIFGNGGIVGGGPPPARVVNPIQKVGLDRSPAGASCSVQPTLISGHKIMTVLLGGANKVTFTFKENRNSAGYYLHTVQPKSGEDSLSSCAL